MQSKIKMTKSIECLFCRIKYCNHHFSLYSDGSIDFYYFIDNIYDENDKNYKRYIFDFNKTQDKILIYSNNGFKLRIDYMEPNKETVELIIKNLIFA